MASSSFSLLSRPSRYLPIRCGPRDNRGPLVKGRTLSTEAIQAVQSIKRSHRSNDPNLPTSIHRLIKPDLIAAFRELLRQDHPTSAAKLFSIIKSEHWYKPDLTLFTEIISALARKNMCEEIDRLICDLEAEEEVDWGDDRAAVRLLKAVVAAERAESTVRIYGMVKRSGVPVGEYFVRVLSRGLRRLGKGCVADEVDLEFGRLSGPGPNLENL